MPDELRVKLLRAKLFYTPDPWVGVDRFFVYAQAHNRQDDADIPGTPIYGPANWCDDDPATDGSDPSVEEVGCRYHAGSHWVFQGDSFTFEDYYLDIPYDNQASTGGPGAWLSNTLRLRAAVRDWNHGRVWTEGWSPEPPLTGADIMGIEDGEYVFRIDDGKDTWDVYVSLEPPP